MMCMRPRSHSRGLNLLLAVAVLALGCVLSVSRAHSQNSQQPLTEAQLEQLVAPIALHPDALVSQILMASTYPLEVVEAARWVKANPKVTGDALDDAMLKQSWDPSVRSLTAFPDVLAMMNDQLSWTQQLGDAFLAQQEDVLAAVQSLRAKADASGTLTTTKQQTVQKQTVTNSAGSSETVIVIEPADPEVIYVPSYDPTIVYGAWSYPDYPPYYWYPPGYVASRALWFAAGVAVGSALWGGCDWGRWDVDIDIDRYNSFNHTKITNAKWDHNSVHRKGVPYRDSKVAERYGKGGRDTKAREQFRGRAESGRQELASRRPDGGLPGAGDRPGGDRRPDLSDKRPGADKRPDLGDKRPDPGRTPSVQRPQAKAPPKVAAQPREHTRPPAARPAHRDSVHRPEKRTAAFHGVGNGAQVKQHSARGKQSRHAMKAHGGGRGGGGHLGGGRGGGRRR